MNKPLIGVVMGGRSAEREISLLSGAGIIAALQALGYPTRQFDYNDLLVDELRAARPAAIFNALHGGEGEDGTVQAIFDWLGIGYQGSQVRACAVAMDKWLTKALAQSQGLPVPRGRKLLASDAVSFRVQDEFELPCVVKPNAEGSAIGVSIVRSPAEWRQAIERTQSDEVLIEEYIEGREFTVAILEDQALPLVEIAPHDSFYSYQAKYTTGGSTHIVPADVESTLAKRMQHDGLELHRALGARDYSRVDIMLGKSGKHAILECNTLPGFTGLSLFPDAARAVGISYEALVERLVLCALSRSSAPWRPR
jgi:D-alanine-D-alanine ligase